MVLPALADVLAVLLPTLTPFTAVFLPIVAVLRPVLASLVPVLLPIVLVLWPVLTSLFAVLLPILWVLRPILASLFPVLLPVVSHLGAIARRELFRPPLAASKAVVECVSSILGRGIRGELAGPQPVVAQSWQSGRGTVAVAIGEAAPDRGTGGPCSERR